MKHDVYDEMNDNEILQYLNVMNNLKTINDLKKDICIYFTTKRPFNI